MKQTWKKGSKQLSIVYPNKKFGGVYALGPMIMQHLAHKRPDWLAKRVYLDEETISGDLIAVSLQYEPDFYHLVSMLKKAGISLDKTKRDQVLLAGGYVVASNPKLFKQLFDVVITTEIEPIFNDILDAYDPNKKEYVKRINRILSNPKPNILDKNDYPIEQGINDTTDKFVFGKSFMLEIERGCPFSCKFCTVPGMFDGRVQYRSLKDLKEIIDTGLRISKPEKIAIISFSMTHPKRKEILEYLLQKNLNFSMPSLNVSTTDKELLSLVKQGGSKSITFAIEGDEVTRKRIGKHFSDPRLIKLCKIAIKLGFNHIKLYVIVGLPQQTDLTSLKTLLLKLKEVTNNKIKLSINPFVPKQLSPYRNEKPTFSQSKRQIKELKSFLHQHHITYKCKSLALSKREYTALNKISKILKGKV